MDSNTISFILVVKKQGSNSYKLKAPEEDKAGTAASVLNAQELSMDPAVKCHVGTKSRTKNSTEVFSRLALAKVKHHNTSLLIMGPSWLNRQ